MKRVGHSAINIVKPLQVEKSWFKKQRRFGGETLKKIEIKKKLSEIIHIATSDNIAISLAQFIVFRKQKGAKGEKNKTTLFPCFFQDCALVISVDILTTEVYPIKMLTYFCTSSDKKFMAMPYSKRSFDIRQRVLIQRKAAETA